MLKDAFEANSAACDLSLISRDAFNATHILSFETQDGKASPEKIQRAEAFLRGAIISMEKRLSELKKAIG